VKVDGDMAFLEAKTVDPDWDDPTWEIDLVERLHDGLETTIGVPLCDIVQTPSGFSPVEAWKLQRGAERAAKLQAIEEDKRWTAWFEKRAEREKILAMRLTCNACRYDAEISERDGVYMVTCPRCSKEAQASHEHMLHVFVKPGSSGVLKEG